MQAHFRRLILHHLAKWNHISPLPRFPWNSRFAHFASKIGGTGRVRSAPSWSNSFWEGCSTIRRSKTSFQTPKIPIDIILKKHLYHPIIPRCVFKKHLPSKISNLVLNLTCSLHNRNNFFEATIVSIQAFLKVLDAQTCDFPNPTSYTPPKFNTSPLEKWWLEVHEPFRKLGFWWLFRLRTVKLPGGVDLQKTMFWAPNSPDSSGLTTIVFHGYWSCCSHPRGLMSGDS